MRRQNVRAMIDRTAMTAITIAIVLAPTALADTTVTFANGNEGWVPSSGTVIAPSGGNPGQCWHTIFNNFGITYRTDSNAEFVQDYTAYDSVTFGVDLKVNDISFFGSPASRPWVLELRDFDSAQGGYPYSSVWYEFEWVAASTQGDWTHYEVTIADTSATVLPAGWGGYGDETPLAEPILPPGVTFADILAGIDEVALTTLEPGWFFGFTDFDVLIDNISIATGGGGGCATDFDGSGATDVDDLIAVITTWGICVGCPQDLNGDNRVNVDDLIELILNWGTCE